MLIEEISLQLIFTDIYNINSWKFLKIWLTTVGNPATGCPQRVRI